MKSPFTDKIVITPMETREIAKVGLITCEHDSRRVTRTEHDGTITVLIDQFEGEATKRA